MTFDNFLREIFVVVVIYKTDVGTILDRIRSFVPGISVFIYDNSPSAQHVSLEGVVYEHNAANGGVSKAYNIASKVAGSANKMWMLLLDQDTVLNIHYLRQLWNCMEQNPGSIAFVPKLCDRVGFVSPFRWTFGKGKRIEVNQNRYLLRNYRFANSGLLINRESFINAGGYQENIPLDFSDIAFGEALQKVTDHFVVVDSVLKHGFSGSERKGFEQEAMRYNFFCKGALTYGTIYGNRSLYVARALFRAVHLAVVFRNFAFIKTLVKNIRHG